MKQEMIKSTIGFIAIIICFIINTLYNNGSWIVFLIFSGHDTSLCSQLSPVMLVESLNSLVSPGESEIELSAKAIFSGCVCP